MSIKWTIEEREEAISLRAEGLKPAQIAQRINKDFHQGQPFRTEIAIRRYFDNRNLSIERCRGIRASSQPSSENPVAITLDKKQAEVIDWREWFTNLKQRQDLHQRTSSSQDEATVKIDTDKKIAILFSADWHTGSVAVDYAELESNLETILNNKRVYMVTVGDLIDNFRVFRSLQPILSQIASPKEQKAILESILTDLFSAGKWIAACYGNHDIERDENLYGESTVKELLSKNLIYFNGKGTLNLIVGEQKYKIRMAHRFQGSSIYNPNHPQNRELKWYAPDADVIVSAHFHQPACQNFYEFNQPKCLIQTGTFQTDDGFAKRHWSRGIVGVPTVVFRPDKHYCFSYPSLAELLEGF